GGASHREGARPHRRRRRTLAHGTREIRIDRPRDLHRPPGDVADGLRDRRHEVIAHPLENELVARGEREHAVGEIVELNAGEPLVERSRRAGSRVRNGLFPQLLSGPGRGAYRMVTRHRHTIHTLSTGLWKKEEPEADRLSALRSATTRASTTDQR